MSLSEKITTAQSSNKVSSNSENSELDNYINNSVKSSSRGISEKEATSLLKKYGYNEFEKGKKTKAITIFLSQFKDILTIILVVSTLLSVLMGEMTEAITIIAIILLNSIMGFIQEYKTEKTLDALKSMAAPTAKVLRDSVPKEIQASLVVPGDIILLEAGDRVPSDATLIESVDLQCDESLLTGESLPIEKKTGLEGDKSKIFMGTMVTRGRAKAVTTSTGMFTEMGKIAGILSKIENTQTPLQKRLAELGKYIAIGCLIVCAIVSITGIIRGEPIMSMIITGISLAVAAVPEGLPAIVTISLALGVSRMLKRNALIRRLPAVETLGCANVICSDKTGTLTENKMTVRKIYTAGKLIDIKINRIKTDFLVNEEKINPLDYIDVKSVLEVGALCNNSKFRSKISLEAIGEPTENALLVSAKRSQLNINSLVSSNKRLYELPFDSDRKCMSIICDYHGTRSLLLKGAPDVIINRCTNIQINGKTIKLTQSMKDEILKVNEEMANSALRVLAFSYRTLPENCDKCDTSFENCLTFLGLQAMMDPPRQEVLGSVRKCIRAGIKTVMITGDHKNTAMAVAKELGILRGGEVVTGSQLDRMSDEKLKEVAKKATVFARVTPAHKLRIVKAFKSNGNVVAMTGDGVNDAPAVKEADIGVSMGLTGTDVTKEASAVILLDDNFASMVSAVEEGRVIYTNIRKFIRYLLSCNIGEVLTMFVGMLMGLPVILTPIQILWVNLVTDGLPAIALGLEPPDDDVMEKKPRGAKEGIFSGGLAGMMIFRGCLIGLCTLGAFITGYKHGGLELARSSAFMTLVFTQLIHVFECKSESKNLLHIKILNNPALVLAVLISSALILSAIYIPFLNIIFGTVMLSITDVLFVLGYCLIGPVVSAFVYRKKKGNFRD